MQYSQEACGKSIVAVKDALYAINGKWKMPVIIALREGPLRFKELQRSLDGITPRVLSKELKEMELNGFITRSVDTGTPVTVTYTLTPYSETLKDVINSLREWGIKHREHIMKKSRIDKSLLKAV